MADELRLGLPVRIFPTADAFGRWLEIEPRNSAGTWLRLARKGSKLVTLSKPEAIDCALCHGWIDGQQHPYDSGSWLTRFTPRRPASRWSEVNRTRALELIALGRMRDTGLKEIRLARADGRWDMAYAPASTMAIPPDLQATLDADPDAASAFGRLSKADRYAVLYRLTTVNRQETRLRHVAPLMTRLRHEPQS